MPATHDQLDALKLAHYHLLRDDPVEACSRLELVSKSLPEPFKCRATQAMRECQERSRVVADIKLRRLVDDLDAAVSAPCA